MTFLRIGDRAINLADVSEFISEASSVSAVMSNGEHILLEGPEAESIRPLIARFPTPEDILALADCDDAGVLYHPNTPPWRRLKTALDGMVKT